MSKYTSKLPGQPGFVLHRSDATIPFQSRIRFTYDGKGPAIPDVAPWGIIVPTTVLLDPATAYVIEVDTHSMPAGTVLGVRWAPHSGSNVHVVSTTLPGDDQPTTHVRVENSWLTESVGGHVKIECEASYPDGRVEIGYSFDIRVVPHPEAPPIRAADLQPGDELIPENYPDGIRLLIDPIAHIEEYNRVAITWWVEAVLENGGIGQLYRWEYIADAKPGESFDFLIPPEGYTGYGGPQYTRLRAIALIEVALFPKPGPRIAWAYGGHIYSLPLGGPK